MIPYHAKKSENTIRPLRYVVLKDDMKLGKENNVMGTYNLFQYMHTLSDTFVFAIPFPMAGTTQLGPLKYAKDYAETTSQVVFESDTKVCQFLCVCVFFFSSFEFFVCVCFF